ncbi:MAG: hypothetical protein AAFQ61_11630 [Cyanobacteria bacterium J06626_23]
MTAQPFQISSIQTQLQQLELQDILSVEEVYRYVQAFKSQADRELLAHSVFA